MADPSTDAPAIWYFAYGSNLHPEKRRNRAAITVLDAVCGVVRGWRLAFDMPGIPPAEPSMANLCEEPGAAVHGLLLKLPRAAFDALVRSEGGPRFYRTVEVEATTYDQRSVRALTLVAAAGRRRSAERPPSRRYLALLRDGARASGLDPAYCDALDRLPETEASALGRACSGLFLEVFTEAAKTPLHGAANRYLALLQRTEDLPALPRALAQTGLLAPTVVAGVALRGVRRALRGR